MFWENIRELFAKSRDFGSKFQSAILTKKRILIVDTCHDELKLTSTVTLSLS